MKPLTNPDGPSKWQVLISGKRVSKHRLKRAAKRAARQEGQMGDELIVHDIQDKEINSVILRG